MRYTSWMTTEELFAALRKLIDDLGVAGRSCALVGGIAVSMRSEVRFTSGERKEAQDADRETGEDQWCASFFRRSSVVSEMYHTTGSLLASLMSG